MAEHTLLCAMPGYTEPARLLAGLLDVPVVDVGIRAFPDGESLVTVDAPAKTAILYGSLDRPNAKLVNLALAASALRDQGVQRLVLVAPYLCYMRQDTAFHVGEAVSQRVIGRWLAGIFDRVLTVDPHLHRTPDIAAVFPGAEAQALSATPVLADLIRSDETTDNLVLIGPDSESRQWVEQLASPLGVPFLIGSKIREGDRDVHITVPDLNKVQGRRAILVDDVVSSGATLAKCAKILTGARAVEAVVVHALCDAEDLAAMQSAGICRLRSTDSIPHPTNAMSLAPLLAEAVRNEAV